MKPKTKPSRPRGPYRSKWHMVHKDPRAYDRRGARGDIENGLDDYHAEEQEEINEDLAQDVYGPPFGCSEEIIDENGEIWVWVIAQARWIKYKDFCTRGAVGLDR